MAPDEEQVLPYSLGLERGVEFRVVDFKSLFAKSGPALNGTMQAIFDPVPSGYWWEIEREVSQTTSTNITPVSIYVGDPGIAGTYRDGSATGQKSVADNRSPIRLSSYDVLSAIWTNANPGDIGTLWIQYKLLERI